VKVISKPEQLKKRLPSKKRTLSDMLVDTVMRIEKKQEEQQKLLENMMKQSSSAEKRQRSDADMQLALWESMPSSEPSKEMICPESSKKEEKSLDFEEAFVALMKAYNAMPAEEKPETIRKLIRNSSTRDTERLSELLDLFWTEGLQREPAFGTKSNNRDRLSVASSSRDDGCSCSNCPHKQELERIDEFYKEFLSTGVAVPGF
jgi:hypothetical protein